MPRKSRLSFLLACAVSLHAQSFDVLIRNGKVIDGTGSPWYSADVGIKNGRIAAIGLLSGANADRVIDAQGMIVAPGFIDMLGQSEITILVNPHLPSKIFQGITTEITGEGGSIAPLTDAIIQADEPTWRHYQVVPDWRTLAGYFARLERQGLGINLATYVGATQVRRVVIGDGNRAPTPAELLRMQGLVEDAMREGAVGLSSALAYAPAPYASTEELIALASAASKYGGIYATHMRNEGSAIMAALDETFRIAREANIGVEIWHLKTGGKSNWGKMPGVVKHINEARAAGLDITADTYAYTAWNNSLSAYLPAWTHDGGDAKFLERLRDPATRARIRKAMLGDAESDWQSVPSPEGMLLSAVQNPKLVPLQGKTIAAIAKLWGKDPIETIFDILIQDQAFTYVSAFGMAEPDVALALEQPWVSICNDSQGTSPEGILGAEHPHPRAYGTFPRILRKYVRQEHRLRLEEAIRKFSALPAQRMRFTDRGVIKQGLWADLVIFDPQKVTDRATYDNPNQLSVGMEYVLVNGVPVIAAGKMTNALPGKVLRGTGRSLAVTAR